MDRTIPTWYVDVSSKGTLVMTRGLAAYADGFVLNTRVDYCYRPYISVGTKGDDFIHMTRELMKLRNLLSVAILS